MKTDVYTFLVDMDSLPKPSIDGVAMLKLYDKLNQNPLRLVKVKKDGKKAEPPPSSYGKKK